MTLHEGRSVGIQHLFSQANQLNTPGEKQVSRTVTDVVVEHAYGTVQATPLKVLTVTAALPGSQAPLPPPKASSTPTDAMAMMAAAFVSAFDAIEGGTITSINDYTQLQQLDQTQSQAVLQSSSNAINTQQNEQELAQAVVNYQKQMEDASSIFGWIMFGLGILLMIGTFISGFFTGGATDSLLPEEFEMLDMAGEGAADAVEEGASATVDTAVDEAIEEAAGNTADDVTANSGTASSSTAASDAEEVGSEAAESTRSWGKWFLKLGIGAAFASPMLMNGIVGFKVADKLNDVAAAQQAVGTALATQQVNNMYYQFLQQLTQREGGNLQEETDEAGQVVSTFATTMNAYRGIAYGLANSV